MKIEALIMKITEVRNMSVYNIITCFITLFIIISLEINTLLLGGLIYLLALYIVYFFLTNAIIHKYSHLKGSFNISKEEFTTFFKSGNILKNAIVGLLPIVIWIWTIIVVKCTNFEFHINLFEIFIFLILLIFLFWSINQMINSFTTTVSLTRVIEYACKNDLIKK